MRMMGMLMRTYVRLRRAKPVPFFSYLVNPYSAALVHHVHQDVLDLELGCRDTLGETKSLIFLFNFLCVFTIVVSRILCNHLEQEK